MTPPQCRRSTTLSRKSEFLPSKWRVYLLGPFSVSFASRCRAITGSTSTERRRFTRLTADEEAFRSRRRKSREPTAYGDDGRTIVNHCKSDTVIPPLSGSARRRAAHRAQQTMARCGASFLNRATRASSYTDGRMCSRSTPSCIHRRRRRRCQQRVNRSSHASRYPAEKSIP